jgi:FAD/FMN-containing dehydrogenase
VNQLASTVTFPDNQNFSDVAYHVWNTVYNTTRVPVAVAQPLDSAQVAALVRCANTANLRMVIRGGGRSYEAMSLINRGIIIDLSKMRQLELLEPSHTDSTAGTGASTADTRRLLVGAGMRLGPVYAYLFQHKLTMEGPTCPTVGVSGATLGEHVFT